MKVYRTSQSFSQGLPSKGKLIVCIGFEVHTAVVMNSILLGSFLDPEGRRHVSRNLGFASNGLHVVTYIPSLYLFCPRFVDRRK